MTHELRIESVKGGYIVTEKLQSKEEKRIIQWDHKKELLDLVTVFMSGTELTTTE